MGGKNKTTQSETPHLPQFADLLLSIACALAASAAGWAREAQAVVVAEYSGTILNIIFDFACIPT